MGPRPGSTSRRAGGQVGVTGPASAIDPSSPTALHEQVAGALRRAIADGEAGPGDRLPPARDLAAVLGVNTNTVLRALRTLRDEGLLEFPAGGRSGHDDFHEQRGPIIRAEAGRLAAA